MNHSFLTGVAVVAALAFSAPVWAQQTNPSGGNSMGTPGPNPGGPGLTPYSSGPRTTAVPSPSAAPSAMAPSAMPPSSMSDTSSAMPPPRHSHAHGHAHTTHSHAHAMGTHHAGKSASLTGGTANQLNQEELQRLQAGNFSNPSAPPPPGMMPSGQPGNPRMTPHGTVQ